MLKTNYQRIFALTLCSVILELMGCVSGGGGGADTTAKPVAAGISIALTDPATGATLTNISSGKPAKVSATVRDTSGAVVPNLVVTFSTDATLATMYPTAGTALTDATGVASIQISPASLTAAGATTITAAATVGSTAVTVSTGFGVIVTTTGVTGISLALTSPSTGVAVTNISTGNPAKVTATVRDASGTVVPNTVVTFATTATLATMIPASGTALTDASGVASIQIVAASPTAAGATTITATASVGGASLTGSAGFSVIATSTGVTGVTVVLTNPSTGAAVTSISLVNPAKVTATVRDASGVVLPNTVVTFDTSATLAAMTPASGTALTDATGVASIQIVAASSAAAGAGTITATATVGGTPISGGASYSVISTSVGSPSVTVVLTDPALGVVRTNISSGKPARVTATVKDAAGAAVPNTVVTFTTTATLANMTPPTGTALTDASGMASIQIDPPSPLAAGATSITASATVAGASISGSASFSVTASSVGVPGVTVVLTDPSTGAALSSISPGSPAKVLATIRDAAGSGVPNAVVTFSTTATLASMTPTTGTALTNSSGVASIQIDAANLTAAGATTISATATVSGASVTGSTGFSVSAANAGLGSFTVGTNPLSPYATTSVSVTVTGVPLTTPVTINFSSICSGAGKATLTSSVQTVNGVATATYTDKGCASTDTITASVAGLAVTKTVTLAVLSPGAASIQFVSATPSTIVLKGTGGAGLVESSLVKFKVVDNNNVAILGADVQFDLTTWAGGILLDGKSTPVSKKTDGNGEVSVSVQSGTTPTAVWVKATVTSATPSFSSQSNQLRISTGRPAQDRFTLGVGSHNIEGWGYNGVTTSVSVIASDRLGNPVPDGTAINFISEGAQIEPSCVTSNGTCGVNFTSANPRPTSDSEPSGIVTKGRVTVAAYTLGEESFVDANGNNKYDSGETFTDLGDLFINSNESVDSNGNPVWDAGEQSISYAANSQACTNKISTSQNAPSKAGTCDGVWGSAHVRQNSLIVLSGSSGYVNKSRPTLAFDPGNTVPDTTYSMSGASKCTNSFPFFAFDQNKNPLPSGTALAASSPPASLGTVTISPAKVGDSSSAGGTMHSILISKPSTTDPTTGVVTCVTVGAGGVPLSVTMTTPKESVSTASFMITD